MSIQLKACCCCFLSLLPLGGQTPLSHHGAVGFQLGQFGEDLTMGLEATSPYMLRGGLAIRGGILLAYRKGYPAAPPAEMTWEPYGVAKVGVLGVGGKVGEHIRLYGEGGLLVAFPRDSFSSESTRVGGYGHFGFEFLMHRERASYFIQLGTVGTGAKADRQVGKPIYLNGFAVTTGFRMYL